MGNHVIALFVLYLSVCLINRIRSEKLTSDRAAILVHATGYGFRYFSCHNLPHLGVLLTWKVGVIGLPGVRISLGDDVCIPKKLLDHLHVGHEKLIHGIIRAKRLHANDFSSDISIELEANCHLAALGQGAVLAEQDHIKDLLHFFEGNAEGKLLPTHHWPVRQHEIFDEGSLILAGNVEVAKGLIVGHREIEIQIHKGEYVLGRTIHDICGC